MSYRRPEIELLKKSMGVQFDDPSKVVDLFEKTIAEYAGSSFAVAVDCATHALQLSLRYLEAKGEIEVPAHTYPSVPMTVKHVGATVKWSSEKWKGIYPLNPYPVVDGSLRFQKSMYVKNSFHCLSFQFKKHLSIGRGGMILTESETAYHWLKKASHDGRNPEQLWKEDDISILGYHYYMTPEDAAYGLLLFKEQNWPSQDLGGWENYPDLRKMRVFRENF